MKIIILLASVLLLSLPAQSQILDSTVIVCQYKAKTIKVTAQKQVEDLIRLEIGKNISKSYSVTQRVVTPLKWRRIIEHIWLKWANKSLL